MAVTSNLYPPIVDTYMPAFLIDSENEEKNICRVYFALSAFNNTGQINQDLVQVVVRNQTTNLNALNPTSYPSGIMLTTLKTDSTRVTDDKYYIEIKPEDMVNNNFLIDQYYKVQIRFTDTEATNPGTNIPQQIDNWINTEFLHFSEWSTVCLIRGISQPSIVLKEFTINSPTPKEIYASYANLTILGELQFADENENETLKSYQIKLYEIDSNKLVYTSDTIYTSNFTNLNEINYNIDYSFEQYTGYYFKIEYTTSNIYSEEIGPYKIYVLPSDTASPDLLIDAMIDEENGCVGIQISRSEGYAAFTGKIIIRRTDNKSNFKIWEDMYVQSYENTSYIKYLWRDYTVESGVWYLYAVQMVDSKGSRSPMAKFREPIMLTLDHIFLTANNKQLKIKFNPQVSSFKRILSESKTETIGSKYPFIKRNGYVDYRQFPLGGLISSAMDETGLFITKDDIYGDYKDMYQSYNEEHDIQIYNDFIYERFFRNKVDEFLNMDGAVLFRSPTEGNILVRLMDINYTPNQTLGRRLWAFTSTAYEIADATVDNYELYNIINRYGEMFKTTEDGTALSPIERIVFIDDESQFPNIGAENVLYVYNKDLYMWLNNQYEIISVSWWNYVPENNPSISAELNGLYHEGNTLYMWNSSDEQFDLISEPTSNSTSPTIRE